LVCISRVHTGLLPGNKTIQIHIIFSFLFFVHIMQLAILEAEQKAEEEEGPETSSKKRGKKKNKH
jgi:uncharacterized protein YhhL (DUF1145 family)